MSDPSPSAPMKPQDTTIFLLGQITEGIKSLREGQAASQLQQAERDAKNERDHEEFRNKIGDHESILAVLKDNKMTTQRSFDNRIQKWMVYLVLPATVLGSILNWVFSKH